MQSDPSHVRDAIVPHRAPRPLAAPPQVIDPAAVDMFALLQTRASALIVGDRLAVLGVFNILWPTLKKPIMWVNGATLCLPPNGSCRTLILEEGHLLSERAQTDLLGWLDRECSPVRVLTVSALPLFPSVEAGRFLQTLYYRLNGVLVTVG